MSIEHRLTRIETLLEGIDKKLGDLDARVKIQNGRVGNLEKWRYLIVGGGAVLAFTSPFVWDVIQTFWK